MATIHRCPSCQATFPKAKALRKHRKKQHGLKCPSCKKVFVDNAKLRRHDKKKHQKGAGYPCMQCNHSFSQYSLLNTHIVTVHAPRVSPPRVPLHLSEIDPISYTASSSNPENQCPVCGQPVWSMSAHFSVFHPTLVCKPCNSLFFDIQSIKDHDCSDESTNDPLAFRPAIRSVAAPTERRAVEGDFPNAIVSPLLEPTLDTGEVFGIDDAQDTGIPHPGGTIRAPSAGRECTLPGISSIASDKSWMDVEPRITGDTEPTIIHATTLDESGAHSLRVPCPVCTLVFDDCDSCDKHIYSRHPRMCCYTCRFIAHEANQLVAHYDTAPRHPKCQVCNVGFRDRLAFIMHNDTIHEPPPAPAAEVPGYVSNAGSMEVGDPGQLSKVLSVISGGASVIWDAHVPVHDPPSQAASDATFEDTRPPHASPTIFVCKVCSRMPAEPTVMLCGHLFCHSCVTTRISKTLCCPVCQTAIFTQIYQ